MSEMMKVDSGQKVVGNKTNPQKAKFASEESKYKGDTNSIRAWQSA